MIEVSNSVPIGFMGKYRGINCNDAAIETLHMEIFSNDIIINDIHNFIVIKETDIPANLRAFPRIAKFGRARIVLHESKIR